MAELAYADFALLDGRFVIEDISYEYPPDAWAWQGGEDGVRGETVRTLTQTRKNVVQPAYSGVDWHAYANEQLQGSATNSHDDVRYIVRQTWQATWGSAFMSWCMRDHLMTLYTLQKGFWLMFDDEMSRDCATLTDVDGARTRFMTPTYPIAFYRAGDPDGQYSRDHLYVAVSVDGIDVDWAENPYRIDHEIGLVAFATPLPEGSIVTMRYLWRAYVRISALNLAQQEMAMHVYTGDVTFEQLTPPRRVDRFDETLDDEPCRSCDDDNERIEGIGDGDEPGPADCGCDVDGPPEESVVNTTLTCTQRADTVTVAPYAVPTDHYIHGVEITSLIAGANKGCAEPPTADAEIDVRLKLNTGPSTFSSWLSKSDQPVRVCDHAYLNNLDSSSDPSWGGVNDCWGKPIGGWSPALVNANGFVLEFAWATACNPSQSANWSYAKTYSGNAIGIGFGDLNCRANFNEAWGSNGEYTNESMYCDGVEQGTLSCEQEGTITHTFTWIGAGDPPEHIDVSVWSQAMASNGDYDPSATTSVVVDNGFGDPYVVIPGGYESSGTHTVRVPVVGGDAVVVVSLHAYAAQGPPLYAQYEPQSDALVASTAAISDDTCVTPVLENLDVVVHHSPVCAVGPKCYASATTSGWTSSYVGEDCGVAASSLGATDGAFSLLADEFDFETLGANSKVVGILVTGEYRVNPTYSRAGNMTVKAHVGTYDAGRTGKTLAYPQTNDWAAFSLGGNGDMWDYSSTFAETGVSYPTATGAQLNSLFKVELLGDNDSGYVYEFRNVRAKVFYFDVCDGI